MTFRKSINKSKLIKKEVPTQSTPQPDQSVTQVNGNVPTVEHESKIDGPFYIFISDKKCDKVKKAFKLYGKTLSEYKYNTFTNIKINELGIKNIWFDISDTNAKNYLSKNLKNNTNYKVYAISEDLNIDWVKDLELYIDKKITPDKLNQHLIGLAFEDFQKNIKNGVEIENIPNKMMSILGVVANQKNKRKILKMIKSILTEDVPIHLVLLLLANTMPCLVAAVEVLQKIKDSNDMKNIVVEAINKNI